MELALCCSDDTRLAALLALHLGHTGAASSSSPEQRLRVGLSGDPKELPQTLVWHQDTTAW